VWAAGGRRDDAADPGTRGSERPVEDGSVSLPLTSAAAQVLAIDEDKVSPGLLGFIVVALLAFATWFLLRSMNKQLRKVDFEERELLSGEDRGPGGGTGDSPDERPRDNRP
jgi:hypothetical protein